MVESQFKAEGDIIFWNLQITPFVLVTNLSLKVHNFKLILNRKHHTPESEGRHQKHI